MKTAEEWFNDVAYTEEGLLDKIKAIQLDAMKEGARRAAEICTDNGRDTCAECELKLKDEILTAAEQLTEKDL